MYFSSIGWCKNVNCAIFRRMDKQLKKPRVFLEAIKKGAYIFVSTTHESI